MARPRLPKSAVRSRKIRIPVNDEEEQLFVDLREMRGEESVAKAVRDLVREAVEEVA